MGNESNEFLEEKTGITGKKGKKGDPEKVSDEKIREEIHSERVSDRVLKYIDAETFYHIFLSIILFTLSMAIHNSETYKIVGGLGSKISPIKSIFEGNILVGVHSLLLAIVFYFVLRYFKIDYIL